MTTTSESETEIVNLEQASEDFMGEANDLWQSTDGVRGHPSFNGISNFEVLRFEHAAILTQLKANALRLERVEAQLAKLPENVASAVAAQLLSTETP